MSTTNIINSPKTAVVASNEHLNEISWWLDSGASEHMCFNPEIFKSIQNLTNKKHVKVGNGNLLKIQGTGTIEILAWNNNSWITTERHNVLFVPDLAINLFSLSKALDKGYRMRSNKLKCELLNKKDEIAAVSERQGNLYKMNFLNNKQHRLPFASSKSRANKRCELIHAYLCGSFITD